MKVGVLTLRFHSNFGFIMQAYAMQYVIKQLGHEPYTYYTKVVEEKRINKAKQVIKNCLLKLIRKYNGPVIPHWPTNEDYEIIDTYTNQFVFDNIALTPYFSSIKELERYDHRCFEAFIVGSDQVWREEFSLNIPTYYFDFVKHPAKKISYAASFGVSKIDYPKSLINKCKRLIRDFSFVSVREKEGVTICRENFGVDAVQVLDPTMLVDDKQYSSLADKSTKKYPDKYIITYILDETNKSTEFVAKLSKQLDLPVVNILSYKKGKIVTPYPSIYDILKGFRDADFIVTDSFHASVFSILFNRQFCVLKNPYRGISRITTLLNTFCISDRIVDDTLPTNQIDFYNINKMLIGKRTDSLSLFNKVLNE